jgi:GAF domain-containing protein
VTDDRDDHVDPEALGRALGRFDADGGSGDVVAALQDICVATAEVLHMDGSGVLLVDEGRVQRSTAASDDSGHLLEIHQEAVGEGPCVDALMYDRFVTTHDVSTDERWPRLAYLMAETDVRAILGAPIHVGGQTIGSLNVYRSTPYDWDDSDVRAVQSFAAIAGHVLTIALLASSKERVVGQLQHALENRVDIERAVGLLMGRHELTAVDAFERLRQRARSEQRKVIDVAKEVLEGRSPEL